jgi:hypothetical protein
MRLARAKRDRPAVVAAAATAAAAVDTVAVDVARAAASEEATRNSHMLVAAFVAAVKLVAP